MGKPKPHRKSLKYAKAKKRREENRQKVKTWIAAFIRETPQAVENFRVKIATTPEIENAIRRIKAKIGTRIGENFLTQNGIPGENPIPLIKDFRPARAAEREEESEYCGACGKDCEAPCESCHSCYNCCRCKGRAGER